MIQFLLVYITALILLTFLKALLEQLFFYNAKEAKRRQDEAVKAIEKEILSWGKEKREEVKKRFLEAVGEIDITKEREREIKEIMAEKLWVGLKRCKVWGQRVGEKVKEKWKAVVEEVAQLADDMGMFEDNAEAEKDKTSEAKKETTMEKADDKQWEIFSKEEKKNNTVDLTEEEWKIVKEAREKNGNGSKKGWLFFKGKESNGAHLSEEEWKVVKDAREKNKKRRWFF